MEYNFAGANHYKTIHTFLDSRKDFIVLGLCGKTGSGCSTAADILQMTFEQMNLPKPGDNCKDGIEAHEYRVLHTYANVHWKPFYRIKTSALITAHILEKSEEEFISFLGDYFKNGEHDAKEMKEIVEDFFQEEMGLCLEDRIDPNDGKYIKQWFSEDKTPKIEKDDASFAIKKRADDTSRANKKSAGESKPEAGELHLSDELTVKFRYEQSTATVFFRTKDLYRIFREYCKKRQEKNSFQNPLLILLLREFIYDFLPKQSSTLWDRLAKVKPGMETIAQQQLGNNLRIGGVPYEGKFDPEAYRTIVVDINYSIKLLSAYLTLQKKWSEESGEDRRTAVVIVSIKNPFESMYLKDRYTNYYLLGIYTEDHVRRLRLSENQRFSNPRIEAIDIVEQLSEFKKVWKQLGKDTEQFRRTYQSRVLAVLNGAENYVAKEETQKDKKGNIETLRKTIEDSVLPLPKDYLDVLNKAKELLGDPLDNEQLKTELDSLPEDIEEHERNTPQSAHISPEVLAVMRTIKKRQLFDEIPFILQNVESCLQSADIFINNEPDSEQRTLLKKKIIRYISLIMNPGLVLPTPVERCMQIAYTAKLNSGCISRQVGAVITDAEYHLLSIGWNQQPEGQIPCAYRDLCTLYYGWPKEAYSDFENDGQDVIQNGIKEPVEKLLDSPDNPLKEQGKLPIYCFKDLYNSIMGGNNQVHPRSLHAEETAFLNLGQYSAEGGILFTTSSPCELCSKKAKYKGIKTIYYVEPYAGISSKHVLNIGPKKSRPNMLLFTGAIGRAYTQLYTPLLPPKDEVELWLGAKLDNNILKSIEAKMRDGNGG